tara:strand:- start:50 stop:307 length:258 start_codon:yes stop_codon:yes gene_type:complete
MKNYLEEIKKRLKDSFEIENIEIVDNSDKHKKHKSYSPLKYHLQLNIKSLYLNSLSRISSQKMIMKILEKDLKDKIHALEIKIEK